VPGIDPTDELIRWDAEGRKVFLLRTEGSSLNVYRFDPASGRRELWKKLGPADLTGVDISSSASTVFLTPDGKAYAYTYGRTLSYLYVVEGLK
jgi:hypothetical protein